MIGFEELVQKIRRDSSWKAPDCLLALDPGETTGWAVFKELKLAETGQLVCKQDPMRSIADLFTEVCPVVVVAENYKVYAWKTKQHAGSELFTPKLLGAIDFLCFDRGISLYLQMAQQAKSFCTNEKLQAWNMYARGQKHARDAIRHGCYWLLFSK